ncbi:hypothetical protein C7S13_6349 [Burkholderia cepacia]|nr:hypothetical protein [Burkholderia cepacia]QOH37574.1 hypothetical protein C7S14_0547 [Burkholderia cepacia]
MKRAPAMRAADRDDPAGVACRACRPRRNPRTHRAGVPIRIRRSW